MHATTKKLLDLDKSYPAPNSPEHYEKKVTRLIGDPTDNSYKSQVINEYVRLFNIHESLVNEEETIDRMERKAQVRNTIFRGITTLVIGFSIMFVYWVAAHFNIAMPLLKLPT